MTQAEFKKVKAVFLQELKKWKNSADSLGKIHYHFWSEPRRHGFDEAVSVIKSISSIKLKDKK